MLRMCSGARSWARMKAYCKGPFRSKIARTPFLLKNLFEIYKIMSKRPQTSNLSENFPRQYPHFRSLLWGPHKSCSDTRNPPTLMAVPARTSSCRSHHHERSGIIIWQHWFNIVDSVHSTSTRSRYRSGAWERHLYCNTADLCLHLAGRPRRLVCTTHAPIRNSIKAFIHSFTAVRCIISCCQGKSHFVFTFLSKSGISAARTQKISRLF